VRVLAFDTATEYLSVCLYDSDAGILALESREGPLRHGANLAPLVADVLRLPGSRRRPLDGVDLVVCPEGPGSFTGLRIGFATAKGLAAASGGTLRTVAVPTIEALAHRRSAFDGVVLPVLDARKGRFYTALFRGGERLTQDMDLSPEEIVGLVAGRRTLTTGFHAPVFAERVCQEGSEALVSDALVLDPEHREPLAPTLARMAIEAEARGHRMDPGSGPRYVRRSDAEMGRERS